MIEEEYETARSNGVSLDVDPGIELTEEGDLREIWLPENGASDQQDKNIEVEIRSKKNF